MLFEMPQTCIAMISQERAKLKPMWHTIRNDTGEQET